MNDLQMTKSGDLTISKYDVMTTDSIEQAILIRLRWFFNEWVYDRSMGVKWFENVLVKNPNKMLVKRMIEDTLLSVDGVEKVLDLRLSINKSVRTASISFRVKTSQTMIDMMETVPFDASPDDMIVYVNGSKLVIKASPATCHVVGTKLCFTKYANVRVEGTKLIIGGGKSG